MHITDSNTRQNVHRALNSSNGFSFTHPLLTLMCCSHSCGVRTQHSGRSKLKTSTRRFRARHAHLLWQQLFAWSGSQTWWGALTKVKACRLFTFNSLLQDNLNISEAANFLVKHIMATENDILKSVVPDTISPHIDSHRQMNCSGCFKWWTGVGGGDGKTGNDGEEIHTTPEEVWVQCGTTWLLQSKPETNICVSCYFCGGKPKLILQYWGFLWWVTGKSCWSASSIYLIKIPSSHSSSLWKGLATSSSPQS